MDAAVVVSDNFDRPNAPNLGANWTGLTALGANLIVTNNQAGAEREDAECLAYWSHDTFSDNQYAQAVIPKIGFITAVVLRADSTQDRFYYGEVIGQNAYNIVVRWDSAWYLVASGTSETWQAGDTLRLEASGLVNPVTIRMYRNGIQVLTWTTSSDLYVKSGGSPGLAIFSQSGSGLTLDNWKAGTCRRRGW